MKKFPHTRGSGMSIGYASIGAPDEAQIGVPGLPSRIAYAMQRSDLPVPGDFTVPSVRRVTRPFQFATADELDREICRAVEYARGVEGLRERTLRWWVDALKGFRRYLRETDAERRFLRGERDLQFRLLEEWVAWMRSRGLLHGSVRSYWRGVLSLFDRLTMLYGYENPLRWFRLPRAASPVPHALEKEEAERLLAHLRESKLPLFLIARNLAIVGLMLYAGLRRGEVIRLRNKDIHRHARAIQIVRAKGRDGGKSRVAYIPAQLALLLARYDAARSDAGCAAVESYFLTGRRLMAIDETTIKRLFATIRKQTGIDVSPHKLRHTYVTLLRSAGVADRIAMDLAGHSSLSMLQRYSTVFSGEHLEAADKVQLDVDFPRAA